MRSYRQRPLVLWTGAGVSWATTDDLGIRGWTGLLDALEERLPATSVAADRDDAPWARADALAKEYGEDRLRREIIDRVRRADHFQKGYKLLTGKLLSALPTVRALAAFSAQLHGFSSSEDEHRFFGRVLPNHRVPAVLTTNYDPYLEAAAAAMFRTPATTLLKPVGAKGSTAGLVGQTPVFHIHGYVSPWGDAPGGEHRDSFVDPVLTGASHARAWEDRADSATIGPPVHLLRHYPTLFVGYSFRDRLVNELLLKLRDERRHRRPPTMHFALVDSSVTARRGDDWFDAHGVMPIECRLPTGEPGDRSDFVRVLEHVYLAGLEEDVRLRGPIRLPEFERGKHKKLMPTGREVKLAGDRLAYMWTSLESSRLGSLGRPPGWPPPSICSGRGEAHPAPM